MELAIVHFSDSHFKKDSNSLTQKKDKVFDAIKNETISADYNYFVISGDIAYSGRQNEYEEAMRFFDGVKKETEKYIGKEISCLIVPGNHDCNFEKTDASVRDTIIDTIRDTSTVKNGFLEVCCGVQESFFDFREMCQDSCKQVLENSLLSVCDFNLEGRLISFQCYNTSWICKLDDEGPGKMYFPDSCIEKEKLDRHTDFSVSVLHHPIHWYTEENRRLLKSVIEDTSDLIITGHEHISGQYQIDDHEGNITEYVEGAILQDHNNATISGFNLIKIDIDEYKWKKISYQWNGSIYERLKEENPWIKFARKNELLNKTYKLNEEFRGSLFDPGITFGHPEKEILSIDDIFIWPYLKELKVEKNSDKPVLVKPINSEEYFKDIENLKRLLVVGSEKSGKSTFCKVLFRRLYSNDYVPVLIDGVKIGKTSFDGIEKLIEKHFVEQYSNTFTEIFLQLNNNKKFIIIDDFDRSRLNTEYKQRFLKNLNQVYDNVIIAADDIYILEEYLFKESEKENVFSSYDQYEILEFGHLLRNKFIKKWNSIGVEDVIDNDVLLRKVDHTTSVIDVIIGKNLVPPYPFFLLVILHSLEAGSAHNLERSSYGYYYDVIITQALGKINAKNQEIDAYYNYVSELAYFLFKQKTRDITFYQFENFHKWYCEEYLVSTDFSKYIENLVAANILSHVGGIVRFKYKYIFYYFVARYLAHNVTENEIQLIISKMCKKLHMSEFANIIMFLTHQSKDPFVLNEILNKAKEIFSDLDPIRLESDVDRINELVEEIPNLLFEDESPDKIREKQLRQKDDHDLMENANSDQENLDYDYDQTGEEELDLVNKLNMTFKSLEIIGQILKSYFGSIKASTKVDLCKEAYFLGLRALNSFLTLFFSNVDLIINRLENLLKRKDIVDEVEAEEYAKKIMFMIIDAVSFGVIKKITSHIGNENLLGVYDKILKENETAAISLIDVGIKLQFIKGFPLHQINGLYAKFQGNILSLTLLKRLVIDHLYMFNVSYKDKQRICSTLKIPMDQQRLISDRSKIKKV